MTGTIATLAAATDTPDGGTGRSARMARMTDQQPTEISIDDFLAAMPQGMGVLNDRMGIELVEISAERVVATMPVEGNTQPYGLLHGGASVVLAETLGSVGSAIHGYPDKLSVGVDINATHHRSATSGTVTGVATAIHLGRSFATLRGGDHRRPRQAGVHLADHLRADARRAVQLSRRPAVRASVPATSAATGDGEHGVSGARWPARQAAAATASLVFSGVHRRDPQQGVGAERRAGP